MKTMTLWTSLLVFALLSTMVLGEPSTVTFTNSKDRLNNDAVEHFVPFTMDYPAYWHLPQAEKHPDFFEGGGKHEEIAIVWYDEQSELTSAAVLKEFTKGGAQILETGTTTVAGLTGKFHLAEKKRGQKTEWSKLILLPIKNDTSGLVLWLQVKQTPDGAVKSAQEVGVKGELGDVLKSLQFE